MENNQKKDNSTQEHVFFPKEEFKTVNVAGSKHAFSTVRMLSKMVNFGFSFFYVGFILSVWFFPQYYTAEIIYNLTIILVFEFILIHSGVFMAVIKNVYALIGFALFYGLFALVINGAVLGDSPIILYLYSFTVLNRMIFGLTSRSEQERNENIGYSALMALNFMVCIVLALSLSFMVPYGGLTPEYLRSIDYFSTISAGGEFPDSPHIAFAFGVLYFGMPILMSLLIKVLTKGYSLCVGGQSRH